MFWRNKRNPFCIRLNSNYWQQIIILQLPARRIYIQSPRVGQDIYCRVAIHPFSKKFAKLYKMNKTVPRNTKQSIAKRFESIIIHYNEYPILIYFNSLPPPDPISQLINQIDRTYNNNLYNFRYFLPTKRKKFACSFRLRGFKLQFRVEHEYCSWNLSRLYCSNSAQSASSHSYTS